jgi:methylglyoxal synthase
LNKTKKSNGVVKEAKNSLFFIFNFQCKQYHKQKLSRECYNKMVEEKNMRIALIAHDKKKQEMIDLCVKYKDVLAKHELIATGTTGTMVMGETGLKIKRMKSGPLGGDQQIGSLVANSELDLIIFLRDPLHALPHEPDITALLRLCDVMNIPLATNVASATIMLEEVKSRKI